MENAVVYARYSSAGQREQSIDGQLAAAQKYASDRGYTIVKEYCDRAKNRVLNHGTTHVYEPESIEMYWFCTCLFRFWRKKI